jgi:acyl carrier protein
MNQELQNQIRSIIANILNLDVEDLGDEKDLFTYFQINSQEFDDLFCTLEDELNVKLPDFFDCSEVGDIIEYVTEQIAKQSTK